MVWIGYRQFDQENSIRPVAIARYDEGYVETVKGTWADSERGNGPLGLPFELASPAGPRIFEGMPISRSGRAKL